MRLRINLPVIFCAILLGIGVTPAKAQQTSETDFLANIGDFRNSKNMLPDYVNAQAKALLAERARKIQGFTSPQQVAERKAYIRARMMQTLGGAFPERTPLNARTVGVIERNGYKIEKVIFESQPKFYVTASLYLPTRGRGPFPAILFPQGHEEGAKAHDTWQQVLGSFAQKGYVALTWDQIGQGERVQMYDADWGESKVRHSTTEHTILGIQCLLTGDNLARYTIWDGIRALDYLLSRPEVDATRIGLTGNSGGGTHTSYLAALEDRIHVAAPSCFITSWSALLDTIGPQDAEQNLVPWIGAGLDHGDFIYAFAPRPFLMLSAIRDFFSIGGARSTYREAQGVYKLLGVPEKLSMVEADDGHGYSKPRRLASYRWFGRWLKAADDQEPEPEVVRATEEELFCTEAGQVTVSLGGETVFTLNQKRAEQLRPTGRPFATEELRQRVRRLTAYEAPKNALIVKPYGEIARAGYRIEKLVYESEPGITIPALLFVPDGGSARKPAMIYVHGRGKSAAAAVGGELEQFVKAGLIVLAIDVRGLGETQSRNAEGSDDFPVYFGDFESAMTALHLGRPLVGMRMTDVLRGVDLLAARADVERTKIYGFGKDAGAIPLLHAAALDERIGKLAVEGMLASYQTIIQQRIHWQIFEQVIPGVLRSYDLPDVVAALAPRQVWIVNGVNALGQQMKLTELKKQYASASALQVAERRVADKPTAFYRSLISQE